MKDYLCKNCEHNNNGWCTKKRIQGLKNITECEYAVKPQNEDADIKSLSDKQFGKREMLYLIQKQIIAIEKNDNVMDKFNALKKAVVGLDEMLKIEEGINGITLDYMIDRDTLKCSKKISQMWKESIG